MSEVSSGGCAEGVKGNPEHPEEILRLGGFDSHGLTRARYGGRWIEVEKGIPGEVVRAEIMGGRRRLGRILEVIRPSPDRVPAACEFFRDWGCGGCQWQHLSYPGQIRHKIASVEHSLRSQALVFDVKQVHALPDPWRYRATATISLGRNAGFRRHGSLAIVPIRDCPISHPLIGMLMAKLNDQIQAGGLPDFRGRVRLDVRLVEDSQLPQLQVLVRRTKAHDVGRESPGVSEKTVQDSELLKPLESALLAMDEVRGLSLLTPDGGINTIKGELFAPVTICGRKVLLAAASFFQTNVRLVEKLIDRLREECEPGKRVADIYGGVGLFGLFLADRASEVIVVENDALATQAGLKTAGEWGLANVSFLNKTAEEALQGVGPVDVVVVDPPRSGLSRAVIEALVKQKPQLILYVSCLAESLSRDLRQLSEHGYGVQGIELFDFYPQTYHVELLAVLTRAEG